MILKEHLLELGFEQKLPWQFHSDSYMVTFLDENDGEGFELWGITTKRYDERVFRGRIRSVKEFNLIFALVKESYNLTEDEIEQLKIAG